MIAYITAAETERLTLDAGSRERLEADPQLATLAALHKGRIAELPAKRLLSVSQHLAEAVPALVDTVEALP